MQPLTNLFFPAAPGDLFKRWRVRNHTLEPLCDSPTDSSSRPLIALMSECELQIPEQRPSLQGA